MSEIAMLTYLDADKFLMCEIAALALNCSQKK